MRSSGVAEKPYRYLAFVHAFRIFTLVLEANACDSSNRTTSSFDRISVNLAGSSLRRAFSLSGLNTVTFLSTVLADVNSPGSVPVTDLMRWHRSVMSAFVGANTPMRAPVGRKHAATADTMLPLPEPVTPFNVPWSLDSSFSTTGRWSSRRGMSSSTDASTARGAPTNDDVTTPRTILMAPP